MNVRIKIKGSSWFKSYRLQFIMGVVAILALAYFGEPQLTQAQDPEKPISVLFIGNSLTISFNRSLPLTLSTMAATATPPITIETDSSPVAGGLVLKHHWDDVNTVNKIRQAGWDFVVLQEWSGGFIESPQEAREFTRKLDAEIKKSGAQTVLFMTWAYRDNPAMIEAVAQAYTDIAIELKAKLAPVGRAWEQSIKEHPDLDLFRKDKLWDKSHQGIHGTYLNACVFYAVLTGKSPLGLSNGGLTEVSEADARFLQEIALETVKKYTPEVITAVSLKDKLPMTWGEVKKVHQKQ